MVTVYIICFVFKKSYILSTQSVCTFRMIITTCRFYFPCSMNTGRFLRFASQIFLYYFRPFACPLYRNTYLLGWHVATSCFSFNPPDFRYPSWKPCSKDNQII